MKTDSQNKYVFKRGKDHDGVGIALLLIFFGILFLLFNLNMIPEAYKDLLLSWKTVLVLIGLWSLAVKRKVGQGILLIGVGVFFLYPTLSSLFPDTFAYISIDFKTYWPVIPIAFGILLVLNSLFSAKKKKYKKWNREYDTETNTWRELDQAVHNEADFFEKNTIFGNSEQIILSQNFKGGEVNVIFGELRLELRKAKLANGIAHLELNTIFGNLIVYVPDDWAIEIGSTNILGAVQDKRLYNDVFPQEEKVARFLIEANSIFGNIEIRN